MTFTERGTQRSISFEFAEHEYLFNIQPEKGVADTRTNKILYAIPLARVRELKKTIKSLGFYNRESGKNLWFDAGSRSIRALFLPVEFRSHLRLFREFPNGDRTKQFVIYTLSGNPGPLEIPSP